eukprot:SAG11_NODE_3974_length_2124_cov_1.061637_3_plen_160_part_00
MDIGALKCGVVVAGSVVKVDRVAVGLIVSAAPLLPVCAEEVGGEDGFATVVELLDVVCVIDDVPVPSPVDPEVPVFVSQKHLASTQKLSMQRRTSGARVFRCGSLWNVRVVNRRKLGPVALLWIKTFGDVDGGCVLVRVIEGSVVINRSRIRTDILEVR